MNVSILNWRSIFLMYDSLIDCFKPSGRYVDYYDEHAGVVLLGNHASFVTNCAIEAPSKRRGCMCSGRLRS